MNGSYRKSLSGMACVRRIPVRSRALELAALPRVDYADAFAVAMPDSTRSPVDWLRALPAALPEMFVAVRAAHRALGLRLVPGDSADQVFGWRVARSDSDAAVLWSRGGLGDARIVALRQPGRAACATLLHLDGVRGRILWTAAAPVHRTVTRAALAALPAVAGAERHRVGPAR